MRSSSGIDIRAERGLPFAVDFKRSEPEPPDADIFAANVPGRGDCAGTHIEVSQLVSLRNLTAFSVK